MVRVLVALPEMREYKQVVILSRPGVVYINTAAEQGAKMSLILPDLIEKAKTQA